jgi:ribosomal protein L7/L12
MYAAWFPIASVPDGRRRLRRDFGRADPPAMQTWIPIVLFLGVLAVVVLALRQAQQHVQLTLQRLLDPQALAELVAELGIPELERAKLKAQLRTALQNGHKIEAIKILREHTDLDLKTSKDRIEGALARAAGSDGREGSIQMRGLAAPGAAPAPTRLDPDGGQAGFRRAAIALAVLIAAAALYWLP